MSVTSENPELPKLPCFKPSVGQEIYFHALPTARNSAFLISAHLVHSTSFPPRSFPPTVVCPHTDTKRSAPSTKRSAAPDTKWSAPSTKRSVPDNKRSAPSTKRSAPDYKRSAPSTKRSFQPPLKTTTKQLKPIFAPFCFLPGFPRETLLCAILA